MQSGKICSWTSQKMRTQFQLLLLQQQTNEQTNQKDNLPQALNMFLIFILLGLKT